jgi:hypothetical protein
MATLLLLNCVSSPESMTGKQPAFSGPKSLKMIRFSLWPGFVPAIQVFSLSEVKTVDARHKAGHDELRY